MAVRSEPARAQAILGVGVLVFRWVALAWMIVLNVTLETGAARPGYAWTAIGVAASFTIWMSLERDSSTAALWIELAIALGLVLASGVIAPRGDIGERAFFATGWPFSATLALGVARGARAGIASGLVLGAGLLGSRVLNGIRVTDLTGPQIGAIVNGTIAFVVAGGAVGYVATLLRRSAAEAQALTDQIVRARERAAALQERASIARAIHDSVLQALALVHKRGRELAARDEVPAREVAALAEMAGAQEAELRALIQREPEEPRAGMTSLRTLLEDIARALHDPPVEVSAAGPLWVGVRLGDELAAAVRQALDNVAKHARASRATVFAELDGGEVAVSVRDDGVGFAFDEDALRARGALGILQSMKGRVEALGGRMMLESGPGGTEVEFRVPMETM